MKNIAEMKNNNVLEGLILGTADRKIMSSPKWLFLTVCIFIPSSVEDRKKTKKKRGTYWAWQRITEPGRQRDEWIAGPKREKIERGRTKSRNLRRRFVTAAARDVGATGIGQWLRQTSMEPESAACQDGGFLPQTDEERRTHALCKCCPFFLLAYRLVSALKLCVFDRQCWDFPNGRTKSWL